MIRTQFVKFVVAGGIAAVANFCSRIAFSMVMPYVGAIVLAYCVGMITAFVLNRRFVFEDATTTFGHQTIWFTLVNLAAVAQTIAVSLLLARFAFPAMGMGFHPETVAHAVGVAVPVVTSYAGHKALTFRNR